jgi:hypothetical protein
VVGAFFEALAPAELDLYEHARAQRRQQQVEVDRAQHYTLQRLEYAADQARRRYEAVDPAYRLVAAELEQRWEVALQITGCKFQVPQNLRRLINVYAINFMP